MHGPLPPYFVPFHVNDYQYQEMKYEVKMARTPDSEPLKFMIDYHPLSNSGMNCYLEPRSVRAKATHFTRGTWFWKTTP